MDAELLKDDPVLGEIVRRLVDAYHPERVYLFGSKARGDAGPDSDYDLMLIVPDDAPPERRDSQRAYDVLWGTTTAADVLVWTKTRFDCRLHLRASFPSTILREGKLLQATGSRPRGGHARVARPSRGGSSCGGSRMDGQAAVGRRHRVPCSAGHREVAEGVPHLARPGVSKDA